MELEDKVAIVTGGSRGIGKAVAIELARNGANVAITYHQEDAKARQVVSQIEGLGRKALAQQCDAHDFQAVQQTVALVLDQLGHVDILFNNAGVNRDGVIWKMTEEQWDEVLQTNLKGFFNFCRAVTPIFREQKSGKIVNNSSINGLRGKFGQTNYSASKAGIIGFSKALAREMGKYRVNVNAVAPGYIHTEMYEAMGDEIKQTALDESVLGRAGTPADVANLVTFLCSEKACHITGEVIKIDGGQYI